MKVFNYFNKFSLLAFLAVGILMTTGCKDDDVPDEENEVEVITDVKLIFTNDADATDVVEASAQDPDGEGVEELKILGEITLGTDKTYTLTYEITNSLADEPEEQNIGAEIREEDDEHQLFYSFTADAFASPSGDGNVDSASDPINYNDTDGNGNSLGLSTSWTTSSSTITGGTFTARLQHQPDVKTATSGASDGDTDFELQFILNIQ